MYSISKTDNLTKDNVVNSVHLLDNALANKVRRTNFVVKDALDLLNAIRTCALD
jgi:hypothetical protein